MAGIPISIGGIGQMSPAQVNTIRNVSGNGTARARPKKRSSGRKKNGAAKRAKKASGRGMKRAKKLVKGSAAAKAYMAKIRKMRKK